ncbi:hypothetical protein BN381_100181 [Candidatus Microthrix parvicella RN1]|uniref:Uncharacterized protein n=1 Tax=Candidatus Neomicrothrix parvicella RN1 TaxID=1229780 RepID=R4YW45_9ACTN|nr:hypothetical protein BN381_100181 [Candidatus Microthrix parvicella RN1]
MLGNPNLPTGARASRRNPGGLQAKQVSRTSGSNPDSQEPSNPIG